MEEKAFALIEQLAKQLGTTAEFVFAALVRGAVADAITWCFIWLVFILLCALAYRKRRKVLQVLSGDPSENVGASVFTVLFLSVLCLLFIFCMVGISAIVSGFYAPEAVAIEKILDALK